MGSTSSTPSSVPLRYPYKDIVDILRSYNDNPLYSEYKNINDVDELGCPTLLQRLNYDFSTTSIRLYYELDVNVNYKCLSLDVGGGDKTKQCNTSHIPYETLVPRLNTNSYILMLDLLKIYLTYYSPCEAIIILTTPNYEIFDILDSMRDCIEDNKLYVLETGCLYDDNINYKWRHPILPICSIIYDPNDEKILSLYSGYDSLAELQNVLNFIAKRKSLGKRYIDIDNITFINPGTIRETTTKDETYRLVSNYKPSRVKAIVRILVNPKLLSSILGYTLTKIEGETVTTTLPCIEDVKEELKSTKVKRKTFPKKLRHSVWNRYSNTFEGECYTCGELLKYESAWHVSHIISHNAGGSNKIDNLVPCCSACNLSMGDMNLYSYIKEFYPSRYEKLNISDSNNPIS